MDGSTLLVLDDEGPCVKKLVGAAARRAGAELLMARGISARKSCRLVGISRSSLAYRAAQDRNALLRERLRGLAEEHPKMGYRMAWARLKDEFSPLNLKRVRRLWNEEGLNLKRKESHRIRVAARPIESAASPNEGWSMDFCHDSLASGLKVKCLVIVDEATRECVALEAHRRIPSSLVVAILERAFYERGVPSYIRCDNGPEFRSWSVRLFLKLRGVKLVWIQPGSPWQNGFAERFYRDASLGMPERGAFCDFGRGSSASRRMASFLQRVSSPLVVGLSEPIVVLPRSVEECARMRLKSHLTNGPEKGVRTDRCVGSDWTLPFRIGICACALCMCARACVFGCGLDVRCRIAAGLVGFWECAQCPFPIF